MREKNQTRQRELLLNYLQDHKGQHLNVKDICAHFKAAISNATVYRLLKQFVDEGLVNKYIIDDQTPACFEYIDRHDCDEKECFHFKCEKCGKLLHLHCDELSGISRQNLNIICCWIVQERFFTGSVRNAGDEHR